MQCNIDARGKVYRLKMGIISLLVAFIIGTLIYFGVLESTTWWVTFFSAITFWWGFLLFLKQGLVGVS